MGSSGINEPETPCTEQEPQKFYPTVADWSECTHNRAFCLSDKTMYCWVCAGTTPHRGCYFTITNPLAATINEGPQVREFYRRLSLVLKDAGEKENQKKDRVTNVMAQVGASAAVLEHALRIMSNTLPHSFALVAKIFTNDTIMPNTPEEEKVVSTVERMCRSKDSIAEKLMFLIRCTGENMKDHMFKQVSRIVEEGELE